VNVGQLEVLAQAGVTEITKEVLLERRIIRDKTALLKILGEGEITQKITLKADKVSATAKAKIEKAGGSVAE